MTQYVIKRIFLAILTVFIIATLTFFLMNLVPGGPFLSEKGLSPAQLNNMKAKYGLDKPLITQYFNYMKNLVKGDLGVSIKLKGRDIVTIIGERFPVSAQIGGIAVLLALLVGMPLGAVAALNRGRFLDRALMVVATVGIAIPGFVVATLLMNIFGVALRWLPTLGLKGPATYILPSISLAFYPSAYISRLMRASMLDVLEQDYIRTAKAKGVAGFVVLFKHALRNAMIPIITYLGPMIAFTLTGSLVVESIFTIPGLGGSFVSSITNRDYTLIMGTTIFLAAFMVFMNLVVDLLYRVVDPRIQFK